MAESRKTLPGGMTPVKLGMILLLSVVLLVVLVFQFGGGGDDEGLLIKKRAPSGAEGGSETGEAGTRAGGDAKNRPPWPQIVLEEVLLHDPFQLPALRGPTTAADQPYPAGDGRDAATQIERQLALLESLRSRGVDMVLMTPRGRVARIGELSVREGDVLEGLLVVEIHPRGIVLQPQAPRAAPLESQRDESQSTGLQQLMNQVEKMIDAVGPDSGVQD